MLSNCFNVSIDYLVGKTDCVHTEYEDIEKTIGLSENSHCTLKLQKILLDDLLYSIKHEPPLDDNDCFDVTNLPNSGENTRQYYNNRFGEPTTIDQKTFISEINKIVDTLPDIFNFKEYKILDNDDASIIEEKYKQLLSHRPNIHFFTTLNKLITYKDGLIIKLLSNYLFPTDMKIIEPFEASSVEDYIQDLKNSFDSPNHFEGIALETLFLYQLQSELINLKNDGATL